MIPIRYVEPVFRPPSEAESLILPVTDGCSWNQCTFCEMYTAPQKQFRARSEEEVLESIRLTGQRYGDQIRRVFLADGDALVLPTRRLLSILEAIRIHMPAVRRISSYCLPRNLRKKSQADIDELAAAGLTMAYVGAESGDDAVLAAVSKGETFDTTCEALDKLGTAGITRSVMILNGLGGQGAVGAACRQLGAPGQRHAAGIPGDAGCQLPAGRGAPARRLPGLGAAEPARTVRRDGALPVRAGAEAHRLPQRPCLELAGSQGNAGVRQGTPVAAGAPGDQRAASRPSAAGLGTRAVGHLGRQPGGLAERPPGRRLRWGTVRNSRRVLTINTNRTPRISGLN